MCTSFALVWLSKYAMCNKLATSRAMLSHAPEPRPATAVGLYLLVVSPVPSCPKLFQPQQLTPPPVSTAQVCSHPIARATAPKCRGFVRSGLLQGPMYLEKAGAGKQRRSQPLRGKGKDSTPLLSFLIKCWLCVIKLLLA